eukprot:TRINITY_DN61250_c0_g1_i1.p1 TRINITY_DN61250_c0_g1~~TRINITY_DN61250_c0_g1_i1.p1  ORF type:complete len:195 (-),score=28.82 TRINITY_DN61250_c0_g1_i1:136-696(-)
MMKRLFLIFALTFLGFSLAQAQVGPKAKNAKPWKHDNSNYSAVVASKNAENRLMGPQAKNAKPWENTDVEKIAVVSTEKNNETILTGPQAKNHKLWKDDTEAAELIVLSKTNRKPLMGPKAKNYKPWKDEEKPTKVKEVPPVSSTSEIKQKQKINNNQFNRLPLASALSGGFFLETPTSFKLQQYI